MARATTFRSRWAGAAILTAAMVLIVASSAADEGRPAETPALPGLSLEGLYGPVPSVAEAERRARQDAVPGASSQVVAVVMRIIDSAPLDVLPEGNSSGDGNLVEFAVFDRRGARRVGTGINTCYQGIAVVAVHCNHTVLLRGRGEIETGGALFPGERTTPLVMSVLGGSGEFAGVGGELRLSELPNGDIALVFHLTR